MSHNLKSIVTSVSEAFVFSGVSWVHYARNIDEHVCFNSVRISRITIGSRRLDFQVTAICHIIPAILVPLIAHMTTCMVTVSVCMSICICSYRLNAHWESVQSLKALGSGLRACIDEDSVRSVSGGHHYWLPGLRRTLQNPAQTSWLQSKGRKYGFNLKSRQQTGKEAGSAVGCLNSRGNNWGGHTAAQMLG